MPENIKTNTLKKVYTVIVECPDGTRKIVKVEAENPRDAVRRAYKGIA